MRLLAYNGMKLYYQTNPEGDWDRLSDYSQIGWMMDAAEFWRAE